MPDETGDTRRERNARFDELSPEYEPPDAARHVWEWFWDLSSRRKTGPEAITYAEIGEWQRLTAAHVRPEEVEMLIKMDDAFLSEVRGEQRLAMERATERAKTQGKSRG